MPNETPPILRAETGTSNGVKLIIQQQGQILPGINVQTSIVPNSSAMGIQYRSCVDALYDPHKMLADFWPKQRKQIEAIESSVLRDANRHQDLPLARIKKIMKLDDDVKSQMISAEAPIIFAKAAEIFIEELTLRSWIHTEENRRKTLQKSDISLAISRCEQFDFLIDIVPRDESLHKQTKMPTVSGNGFRSRSTFVPHNDDAYPTDSSSLLTGGIASDSGIQYYIQLPANSTDQPQSFELSSQQSPQLVQLQNGQMVQAMQIGQPIPFQSSPGQSVQLITIGNDGQPIQLQLQMPSTQEAGTEEAQS